MCLPPPRPLPAVQGVQVAWLDTQLLPEQGMICCRVAAWQCFNRAPGKVPHIFQCLNCFKMFVRGRVSTGGRRFTGGADLVVVLPEGQEGRGTSVFLAQPTVVVPTRGMCFALTNPFQGNSRHVATLVPRKEGASIELLSAWQEMPNISHPNFREMWTAITRSSIPDPSFDVGRWAVWLARTLPLGEPTPSSRFLDLTLGYLPETRTEGTAFCEHYDQE